MRYSDVAVLAIVASVVACGESLTPPEPPRPPAAALNCSGLTEIVLGPGQSIVLGAAASAGCIRLPAGQAASEYLAVAYASAGRVEPDGISASYRWRTSLSPAISPADPIPAAAIPDGVTQFHTMLRARERDRRPRGQVLSPTAAPTLGEHRSFGVCSDATCVAFTRVPATVAYVGRRIALFLDDSLPAEGVVGTDFEKLGRLFDDHLYPIDTTAFGRESDIDGNGVVLALITREVNRLCLSVGGLVTGYFYGLDLDPSQPGSNAAEVFFAAAPDPQGETGCKVTRDLFERIIPGTFVHELQHMISYNQHVLLRGASPEDDWLNEGLSHLAEELGGRRVPSSSCRGNDCLSQFVLSDVSNAYQYLFDPERWHVVTPQNSVGRSAERGAAWLLLRWTVDHYGAGDNFTRSLVQTSRRGAANLAAATNSAFDNLVGEWHLANYLGHLPGFTPANSRLKYTSWNWRVTFAGLRDQSPIQYPRTFPLVPDSTRGSYDHSGTLRGGSGRHLRLTLAGGGDPIDVRLSDAAGSGPPAASLEARVAIARIR